jgi:hypothetical protein
METREPAHMRLALEGAPRRVRGADGAEVATRGIPLGDAAEAGTRRSHGTRSAA